MRKSTIKKRLASRYAQFSLIIFILSLGLYQIIRPGHSLIALLAACALLAGLSFLAAVYPRRFGTLVLSDAL